MKILDSYKAYNDTKPAVITMGAFDGVHAGHRKVLAQLKDIAKQNDSRSVVLTFVPHPRIYFNPNTDLRLLNTLDEKIALLKEQDIDYLILQPFDAEFAGKSPEIFINELVSETKMKHLLMGYDHSFGKNGAGNFDLVKKLSIKNDFEVHQIEELKNDVGKISSTAVRKALLAGKVEEANQILGYPYMLMGKVVKGNQLGRTIGFPTANIQVEDKYKLFPKKGVYVVSVQIDNATVFGMMNLGLRPTVDGKKMVIEVYLFDFDQDIYGQSIRVSFLKRLRDEQKFSSVDALKKQLELDEITSRKYIETLQK